jgi:heme O synthase-like polyprenyltransferase
MLPVTHGEAYTRLNILLYTILLVLVTILPYLIGMSGLIYLLAALLLDAFFLYYAIQMYRVPGDQELPMIPVCRNSHRSLPAVSCKPLKMPSRSGSVARRRNRL